MHMCLCDLPTSSPSLGLLPHTARCTQHLNPGEHQPSACRRCVWRPDPLIYPQPSTHTLPLAIPVPRLFVRWIPIADHVHVGSWLNESIVNKPQAALASRSERAIADAVERASQAARDAKDAEARAAGAAAEATGHQDQAQTQVWAVCVCELCVFARL